MQNFSMKEINTHGYKQSKLNQQLYNEPTAKDVIKRRRLQRLGHL